MTSITERLNELTGELDKVNSVGILRLLRQCDSQIFSGYLDYQSLNDSGVQNEINQLVDRVVDRLNNGFKINVVITGAGTSGRLAYFISRSFNQILYEKIGGPGGSPIKFNYLIAGGDLCLTVGMEGAEDNISQALTDIKSQVNDEDEKEIIVYVGITCGFSAPYVAAQLNYLLDLNITNGTTTNGRQHIISLMGFNPIELARKIKIEKWDFSFNDIVIKLNNQKFNSNSQQNYFIINPIFGPEPLTGSTRMKSGTGTKILLETIFSLVLNKWKSNEFPLTINGGNGGSDGDKLNLILKCYEITCRETYYNIESISGVIDSVGNSLKNKGHCYYLGSQSLGIVGFIDASETLPTFGARPLDVCGFIMDDNKLNLQGWQVMGNRDLDLSHVSDQYKISQSHFINSVLPTSNENDTIIISIDGNTTGGSDDYNQFKLSILPGLLKNSKNQSIHLIYFNNGSAGGNSGGIALIEKELKSSVGGNINFINLKLSNYQILNGLACFYEISLKWILNSVTTGGFVLAGKVVGNRMIDLGLTNNKLFFRSVGIINSIMKLDSEEKARLFLLHSVYSIDTTDEIPLEIKDLPVYRHIEFCDEQKVKSIVPVALLLASGKFNSPSKVREEIKKQPIIRVLLDQNKPL